MPKSVYIALWFTVTIPALVGIVSYRRLLPSTRIIAILMCLGFLTELLLRLSAHTGSNVYIANVYTCLETLLLAFFFSKIVAGNRAKRIVRLAGVIVFCSIITEMVFEGINVWVSFSSSLESIYIIAVGLYYFYEVAMVINPDTPSQCCDFWLTAIILFYFMSSLEYFLLNRYLVDVSRPDLMMLGNIHTFVNAFCNLAYGLVLWKFTRSYSLAQ